MYNNEQEVTWLQNMIVVKCSIFICLKGKEVFEVPSRFDYMVVHNIVTAGLGLMKVIVIFHASHSLNWFPETKHQAMVKIG